MASVSYRPVVSTDNCPICFMQVRDPVAHEDRNNPKERVHAVCIECIRKWVFTLPEIGEALPPSCPSCRNPINLRSILQPRAVQGLNLAIAEHNEKKFLQMELAIAIAYIRSIDQLPIVLGLRIQRPQDPDIGTGDIQLAQAPQGSDDEVVDNPSADENIAVMPTVLREAPLLTGQDNSWSDTTKITILAVMVGSIAYALFATNWAEIPIENNGKNMISNSKDVMLSSHIGALFGAIIGVAAAAYNGRSSFTEVLRESGAPAILTAIPIGSVVGVYAGVCDGNFHDCRWVESDTISRIAENALLGGFRGSACAYMGFLAAFAAGQVGCMVVKAASEMISRVSAGVNAVFGRRTAVDG